MKAQRKAFAFTTVISVFLATGTASPAEAVGEPAAMTCGGDSFACGNLEVNGTCCRSEQRCCYVPREKGTCYCVATNAKCDRYQ